MVNLNNLKFFYYAAKKLSFTTAASDLCVTQSAVSKRIKRLEEDVKLKLFVKHKGKSFLTEEGKSLFEFAEKIIEYEKTIEKEVNDVKELRRGILRIGSPKTFSPSLMDFLVNTFHHNYPDIKLHLITGNSSELINGVLNHKIEIALHCEIIETYADIHHIHLARLKIAPVVGPIHPLAKEKALSLRQLAEGPIILREEGSGVRKRVLELFDRHGLDPHIFLESNSPEEIKHCVQKGKGLSFFIERSVSSDIDQGKLIKIPLKGIEIFSNSYLAYLKYFPLSIPAREYLRLFAEAAANSPEFPNLLPSWSQDCPYLA